MVRTCQSLSFFLCHHRFTYFPFAFFTSCSYVLNGADDKSKEATWFRCELTIWSFLGCMLILPWPSWNNIPGNTDFVICCITIGKNHAVWAQIIWQLNQTLKFQVEHCMHFTNLSHIERLNHSKRSQEIHHINAIYIIVEGSHLVLCEKRQAKHMMHFKAWSLNLLQFHSW